MYNEAVRSGALFDELFMPQPRSFRFPPTLAQAALICSQPRLRLDDCLRLTAQVDAPIGVPRDGSNTSRGPFPSSVSIRLGELLSLDVASTHEELRRPSTASDKLLGIDHPPFVDVIVGTILWPTRPLRLDR
jgi:hypothetical protein